MTKRSVEYEKRIIASGIKRHAVFIPDNPEAIESIKRSAKRLRKKHGCLLPTER